MVSIIKKQKTQRLRYDAAAMNPVDTLNDVRLKACQPASS